MSLLKNIVSFEKGKKYDLLENYEQGATRVFQANDMRNEKKPQYTFQDRGLDVKENDILLVWDGSVGQMGTGRTGFAGSTIMRLRVKEKARFHPLFVYRFLQTKAEYLKRKATGATIKHINRKSLEAIEVPDIDISDQLHIAKILDKAENLITKRKESIKLLDEFLKSTFLEMFGDPVRNEKGFHIHNLKEFYATPKEGTKCGPFGSALKKHEYTKSGIPVWTMDNILADGQFQPKGYLWINKEKHEKLKKYNVKNNDIIISRAGTVGKMCIVRSNYHSSIISSNLIRLRLSNNLLPIYFLSLMKYCQSKIIKLKHGNEDSYTHMSTKVLDKIVFPYPSIELQNKFAQIVAKTEILKTQYQQSLSELKNLYGSLSKKAFAGKLTLNKKAEIKFGSETELSIPQSKKGFAKLVLAGKIISLCKDSKGFTDIKFQKLQHLSEHLMEVDLNLNYYNQAAGPYDNRFMHTLHDKMEKQKWFSTSWHKYYSMEKANEIDGYFTNYFGSNNKQFDKLIKLLGNASEDQCEIISTLYAVWNDKIIKGETIIDEKIINDFYNWSSRKRKYTNKQLHEALNWMKEKELEPKGFGELIKHKKK